MSLRRAYAPMLPEFDSFLFAPVGEEVDGVPLSVLSALSRLGLDPRHEAARLSHLTKEAAADQLPTSTAGEPDAFETGAEPAPGSRTSSLLIYLALAIALIVGLVASGFLSFGG